MGECFPLDSARQHLVKELAHGTMRFQDGRFVVHRSGQVSVGEGNSTEGSATKDFAGCGLAVLAEEKARLGAYVGVAPAVENDPGNIAAGIEPRPRKHFDKLLTDRCLIFPETRGEQLGA